MIEKSIAYKDRTENIVFRVFVRLSLIEREVYDKMRRVIRRMAA